MFQSLLKKIRLILGQPTQRSRPIPSSEPAVNHPRPSPAASPEEISVLLTSAILDDQQDIHNDQANTFDEKLIHSIQQKLKTFQPDEIPKLAQASTKLLQMLTDLETPAEQITEVIQQDPALLGKVLQQVNSPRYRAQGTEITDLSTALIRLGNDDLKRLVLSSLLADQFTIQPLYFKCFGANIWKHSHQVALMASIYAKKLGVNPFHAYLNGLIHDVGKLVIFRKLIELMATEAPGTYPSTPLFSYILERFGQPITLAAIEQWQLEPEWVRPIMQPTSDPTVVACKVFQIAHTCAELYFLFSRQLLDNEQLGLQLNAHQISFQLYSELTSQLQE